MWRKMYFLNTWRNRELEYDGNDDENENLNEDENMCTETPNSNDYSAKIVQLYPDKFNINAKER